jgi:hypothetical protein
MDKPPIHLDYEAALPTARLAPGLVLAYGLMLAIAGALIVAYIVLRCVVD